MQEAVRTICFDENTTENKHDRPCTMQFICNVSIPTNTKFENAAFFPPSASLTLFIT